MATRPHWLNVVIFAAKFAFIVAVVVLALRGARLYYAECARIHPWWYCIAR